MKLNKLVNVVLVIAFSIAFLNANAQESYSAEKNGVKILDLSRTAEKSTYQKVTDPAYGTWPEIIWRAKEAIFTPKLKAENLEQAVKNGSIHPELARMESIFTQPVIFKLAKGVYNAFGFEGASITIIEGKTGLIVADAGSAAETARAMMDAYRVATGSKKPVHTLFYTHHHPDQWSGTEGIVDRADYEAGKINVIAHTEFQSKMNEESGSYLNQQMIRTTYAFGLLVPHKDDYTGRVNQGVGYPADIIQTSPNKSYFAPNILVDDQLILKIDGLTLEFFHTPGEAPDGVALYVHETGTLVAGDTIQGETIPNLYTIRGAEYRDGLEWAESIDRMRRYHATNLALHHGRSNVGKERVEDIMKAYADALRYMQDQTVRYINKGYTMHELSDLIRLPDELKDHDYLRPIRGSEYQNVANIYAGNVGWYNGDPTEFAKPKHKKLAQLYVDMMGGADTIRKAARKFIAEGKNGEAMQILTHVIRVDHDDMESRELKAQAMENWALQQSTPGWRHWGLTGAMELRNKVPTLSGGGFFGDADKFSEAPTEDILDLIPSRLKAEELKANEAFKIQVDVEGEKFLLSVGNRVLAVDPISDNRADLEVKVTRKQLVDMFIVQTKSASKAGITVVRGDVSKLNRLIKLTDTFSQFQLIVR